MDADANQFYGNDDQHTSTQWWEQSSIKFVLLTVPVTLTLGQLGIFSNGLQSVFNKN